MPEPKRHDDLAQQLLSQDPPPADTQLQHNNALFKKIKLRLWTEKIATGTIYALLFSAAFGASQQADRTKNLVHAICWTMASAHILLWFLVYFLWRTHRLVRAIMPKSIEPQATKRTKEDRLIEAVAVLACLGSTLFLCSSFMFDDPLKAIGLAKTVVWAPVFFLGWYPFGTASRLGKLWLAYKRMELELDNPDEQEPDDSDE